MKKSAGKHEVQEEKFSLRQKVYAQIKHDIITCKLEPGEPLSENQFVEQFQTSKTPIREALTSLIQDRLVEYITNRGFMVSQISVRDVQEIFDAREFYETTLYRMALKRISDADVHQLESYAKIDFDLNDPGAIDLILKTNQDFHLHLARIAGNSRMYWHYASLLDEAQRLFYMDFKNGNILPEWHHSHHGILEAIRCRDEAAGVQAIHDTLDLAKRRILGAD